MSYCVEDEDNVYDLESIEFRQGKYLSYSFCALEDETKERINEFIKYITNNRLDTEGNIILIVRAKASMVSGTGFVNELQIKIK